MATDPDAGSLKRGVRLLRLLATAGAGGSALTELAAQAGLPHPSAHRVLKQLQAERLVEHHPDTRRYRLGPLAFELGLAASTQFDMRDLCEAAMQRLASVSADTVYLVGRSGFDAVCLHRVEGAFPIRTLVLEVGSRRPLGVGAGGLAVLAAATAVVGVAPGPAPALPVLALAGAVAVVVESSVTQTIQVAVPDEHRAGALGLGDSVMVLGALLGSLLAPPLAEAGGPRLALGLCAGACLAAALASQARLPIRASSRTWREASAGTSTGALNTPSSYACSPKPSNAASIASMSASVNVVGRPLAEPRSQPWTTRSKP